MKKRAYIIPAFHLELFEQILPDNFKVSPQLAKAHKAIVLTYEEENAVAYVVQQLKKKKDVDVDVLIDNKKSARRLNPVNGG